ncbi:MAG: nuclear transport factor 2 family protein, partial [Acidimicrobiia bacterium]
VEKRWALAERFFAAAEQGDTDALAALLAADVVVYGDGGGKAPARRSPIRGAFESARFLATFGSRSDAEQWTLTLVDVNGQPGAVVHDSSGAILSVISLDVADGKIQTVRAVVNPDKLQHLSPSTG